jgi:sugar lactone lactonase YvrE
LSPAHRQALEGRIQQREDQLIKASRLMQVKVLSDLSGDRLARLSQIAVQGENIYALDTGGRRVLKVTTTNGKPLSALSAGSVIGRDMIQPLVAITAIPGGVLAADSRDTLWAFDAATGQVRRIVPPGADWGEVRAMATYNDELYILGPQQNRVWRYSPDGEGYGSPTDYFAAAAAQAASPSEATPVPTVRARATATPAPTATPIPAPDLRHSVDLAVDGSVYVLQADGSVLKFTNGLPEAFPETGLVGPMPSPSHITTSPRDSSVYIVDPAGKRIVRFSKSGLFQRQYVLPADAPSALTGIQSAAIDTAHQLVYLLSDKAMAVAPLPSQ